MLTSVDLSKYFKSSKPAVAKTLLETIHGMVPRDSHTAIRKCSWRSSLDFMVFMKQQDEMEDFYIIEVCKRSCVHLKNYCLASFLSIFTFLFVFATNLFASSAVLNCAELYPINMANQASLQWQNEMIV